MAYSNNTYPQALKAEYAVESEMIADHNHSDFTADTEKISVVSENGNIDELLKVKKAFEESWKKIIRNMHSEFIEVYEMYKEFENVLKEESEEWDTLQEMLNELSSVADDSNKTVNDYFTKLTLELNDFNFSKIGSFAEVLSAEKNKLFDISETIITYMDEH